MSKLLFFLIVLISFSSKAQTSSYFPIPDSAIVWQQEGYVQGNSCCCTGTGPCLREDSYQYFLSGDTLIGSFTYKKILRHGSGQEYILLEFRFVRHGARAIMNILAMPMSIQVASDRISASEKYTMSRPTLPLIFFSMISI